MERLEKKFIFFNDINISLKREHKTITKSALLTYRIYHLF